MGNLLDKDWSEELCIVAIAVVAIWTVSELGVDSSNIVSAAVGGLIGYLTRRAKEVK